jgi:AAA domain
MVEKNIDKAMDWGSVITDDGLPETQDKAKSTDGTGLDTSGFDSLLEDDGAEQEPAETEKYTSTGPKKFSAIPMSELMGGDYKIEYLCNGVLAKDQPAVIGGPQKAFKTSIALELAVCLATGEKFLGHFSVPEPVTVCFFSGEGGLSVIQDTLRRIGEARDIDISKLNNFFVTDDVPRLDNREHLAAVEEHLKKYKPEVCFIDPLYLAISGADTSNVFSMGERLRELNRVCLPLGCTPVLLHHLRKTRVDLYKPAGLEDLSMSGIAEFAGQWVLLSRRSEYNPDDPPHRLWISFGGRTGHGSAWGLEVHEGTNDSEGGRKWDAKLRRQAEIRSEVTGATNERQRVKQQAKQVEFDILCKHVLEWMATKSGGVVKAGIRARFRIGDAKVNQIVMELTESGAIEECKVMVKNKNGERPADGYKAVSDDEANLPFFNPPNHAANPTEKAGGLKS